MRLSIGLLGIRQRFQFFNPRHPFTAFLCG